MRIAVCLLLISVGLNSWAAPAYPLHPDESVTPGSLCQHPTERRYPEKIAYCKRDVSTDTKVAVINVYEDLGYKIWSYDRKNFKIDHFIPLCMGGSNETDNLWPQHKSVYAISDMAEGELCQDLKDGHITQAEAIRQIKELKESIQRAYTRGH